MQTGVSLWYPPPPLPPPSPPPYGGHTKKRYVLILHVCCLLKGGTYKYVAHSYWLPARVIGGDSVRQTLPLLSIKKLIPLWRNWICTINRVTTSTTHSGCRGCNTYTGDSGTIHVRLAKQSTQITRRIFLSWIRDCIPQFSFNVAIVL